MIKYTYIFVITLALIILLVSASSVHQEEELEHTDPLFLYVFTEKCWDSLIMQGRLIDFENFDIPCVKHTVSKAIGVAIISLSFVLKVPQMLKIIRAKGTTGLSIWSFYLELVAFTTGVIYNMKQGYDFNTYGESVIIMIECGILVLLFWFYSSPGMVNIFIALIVYSAQIYGQSILLPHEHLPTMVYISMVVINVSRILQIATNFSNGHTGLLAAPTLILNLFGSASRVLTTIQSHGDIAILISYGASLTVNTILLLQVAIYRKKTKQVVSGKAKSD